MNRFNDVFDVFDEYEKRMIRRGIIFFLILGFLVLPLTVYIYYKQREESVSDNVSGSQPVVASPEFSVGSGFYDSSFELELSSSGNDSIFYTTDGSIPDASSMVYEGPIIVYDRSGEDNHFRTIPNTSLDWYNDPIDTEPVRKCFIVRAAAYSESTSAWSDCVTATYFVGADVSEDRYTVSLVADPDDMFGENGIYVTGTRYDEWYSGDRTEPPPLANFEIHGLEIPASFELFKDDTALLTQNVGVRVRAHSNRDAKIKQFSVYARESYGDGDVFSIPLFDGKQTHSVALRMGLENAFMMYFGEGRDVAYQESYPVDVFLNGEYWYSAFLQEKYNDRFFEETYGIEHPEIYKARFPQEVLELVYNHDMSDPTEYEKFCSLVDVQSYIDYSCINVYIANCDYYIETGDNSICWCTRGRDGDGYSDGRLRWCLYDLDRVASLCRYEQGLTDIMDSQIDSFNVMNDWAPTVSDSPIFSALKNNPEFCREYVNTFMDLVNTTFAVENVEHLLQEWETDLSFDDNFFIDRSGYITGYMADEFGLTGTLEDLTIETDHPDAGVILINTITPDLSTGIWTGQYYTDYPVTVTAVAGDGHTFVKWTGDIESTDACVEVTPQAGGTHIYAVFE